MCIRNRQAIGVETPTNKDGEVVSTVKAADVEQESDEDDDCHNDFLSKYVPPVLTTPA